jgi:hypothetical protein
VGQDLLIHEASTLHNDVPQSIGLLSSSQRPLPHNTQHSQQTNIHAPSEIQTHNISRRAAADLPFRPRGRWDWLQRIIRSILCLYILSLAALMVRPHVPLKRRCVYSEVITSNTNATRLRNDMAQYGPRTPEAIHSDGMHIFSVNMSPSEDEDVFVV